MAPEFRDFLDAIVIPALLDKYLSEIEDPFAPNPVPSVQSLDPECSHTNLDAPNS